ncbi:MAG: hypothetical protein H6807_15440 [Planctomycetes bacterium]|nr:hypothetical protein [Planctomycetota bacterium]
MSDDVGLGISQKGELPGLDLGEFDVDDATDASHAQPVSFGLPVPYEATASVFGQTICHREGEPDRPIQLFAGYIESEIHDCVEILYDRKLRHATPGHRRPAKLEADRSSAAGAT